MCFGIGSAVSFVVVKQVQPLLRVRSLLTEVGREQSSPFGITVVLVFVGFRA